MDTRERYLLKLYNKALYLNMRSLEEQLVGKIAMQIKNIIDLKSMVNYLRKIDEINKQRRIVPFRVNDT